MLPKKEEKQLVMTVEEIKVEGWSTKREGRKRERGKIEEKERKINKNFYFSNLLCVGFSCKRSKNLILCPVNNINTIQFNKKFSFFYNLKNLASIISLHDVHDMYAC